MKRSKINGFPIFGGVSRRKEARHWYRLVSEKTLERGSEALGGDSYGC